MKKASRQHRASDNVAEYDARVGTRGKYAAAYGGADVAEELHVWAPLASYLWSGSERTIVKDTRVRLAKEFYALGEHKEFKYALSEEEWNRCRTVRHWLFFTHSRSEPLSAKAKMNAFLLSLWIARPTRTNIPFRFDISESGRVRTVSRVLERFQWVERHVEEYVRNVDLAKVAALIQSVREIAGSRGRLKNALALTLRGCVASEWQSAIVCFAAASEAMLTYSSGPGMTKRLARAYARLVSTDPTLTGDSEEHFERLYRVRSDIVHGRAHDRANQSENLEALALYADAIRRLWSSVLLSPNLRAALDGTDEQRAALFDARGADPSGPPLVVVGGRGIDPEDE
jgi:hypothetical protein